MSESVQQCKEIDLKLILVGTWGNLLSERCIVVRLGSKAREGGSDLSRLPVSRRVWSLLLTLISLSMNILEELATRSFVSDTFGNYGRGAERRADCSSSLDIGVQEGWGRSPTEAQRSDCPVEI